MDCTDLPDLTRSGIPVFNLPNDPMRHGIKSLRGQTLAPHPVDAGYKNILKKQVQTQNSLLTSTYGSHFVLRTNMEKQILSQFQRLPGLHSEHVGLKALLDLDETIEYEDILNDPRIAYEVKGL